MAALIRVLGLAALSLLVTVTANAGGNLLVNPSFESPPVPVTPPEYAGAGDGWTSFGGGIFTIGSVVGVPPQDGDQLVKMFGGCCSGAWQQFPTAPGMTWNGGVWMRNDSLDPMSGGQVAAVNIEWIQADGETQSTIIPFISNGTFTAPDAPRDEWVLQTITGDAPADAAFARFVIITGDFLPGGPGGAPFYDNAFFELIEPVPVEETTIGRIKSMYR
jgi:hypothetical protein